MDEGNYEVQIAASSRDIRLKDIFFINKIAEVEKVGNLLFPNIHPKSEIKPVHGNMEYDELLNIN